MNDEEPRIQAEPNGFLHDAEAFAETHDEQSFAERLPELEAAQGWRAAESLLRLRTQVNAKFPNRNKSHDGMIGDLAHCPGSSDHCPNIIDNGVGVVTAYDITHDPQNGCDMNAVMEALRQSRDNRIKYVIWNRRIYGSYEQGNVPAWQWRPYSGSNPHSRHAHVSVLGQKARYDDTSDWKIT